MREAYSLVWSVLVFLFRSRVSLEAEILILRHQLNIQRRHVPKSGLQCRGSPDLCWAVSFGAKCHQGADDREARYRQPLASCRFQIVLALEIPEPLRPTDCTVGNSPADPRDEHRQPVVGSAENPWRASQARHR